MALPRFRQAIFDSISEIIGSTPLRAISKIEVPNGVKIYVKEEYKNPTGSHYDRLTLELFKGYESSKGLKPTAPIVETSTGSSGASFAWMAKILGYENATVIIPKDMPSARIAQIKSYGAKVEFSEEGTYITGLIRKIKKKIDERKKNRKPFRFLNHSHDEIFSIRAMNSLGEEILTDFNNMNIAAPNYAILALGNGTSARGISSVLESKGTQIYGMEPFESPAIYKEYFSEKYTQKFGKNYVLSNNHIIYGTGAGCEIDKFPNLTKTVDCLKDVFHPTRKNVLETRELIMFKEMILAGNSSAACLWSALQLAKDCKEGDTIVTIMYDAAWRYLDLKRDEYIYES